MENKYSVSLSKKAEKFIRKQDKESQKRIIKSIIEIPEGDIKKLKGLGDIYRLRVGDFRILFEKNHEELVIIIIDVGNRGRILQRRGRASARTR